MVPSPNSMQKPPRLDFRVAFMASQFLLEKDSGRRMVYNVHNLKRG